MVESIAVPFDDQSEGDDEEVLVPFDDPELDEPDSDDDSELVPA